MERMKEPPISETRKKPQMATRRDIAGIFAAVISEETGIDKNAMKELLASPPFGNPVIADGIVDVINETNVNYDFLLPLGDFKGLEEAAGNMEKKLNKKLKKYEGVTATVEVAGNSLKFTVEKKVPQDKKIAYSDKDR